MDKVPLRNRMHACLDACEARDALGIEVVHRDGHRWELVDVDGRREPAPIATCPFCGARLAEDGKPQ